MKCLGLVLVVATVVASMPTENTDGVVSSALNFVKDCGESDISLCFKERALRFVDGLNGNIDIAEGISLVSSPDQSVRGARALKDEPLSEDVNVRENQVEGLLVDRVARFLEGHTLQFKVPKDSIDEMKRSMEEGRKKKKKLLLPLLLLLKLKAAALIPLLLGFLALVAFKALIIGKLALLISGIIGFKKLLDSKNGGSSYEVVSHPHYAEEHHGGAAHGWGRSAQELAYGAQKQE